jgi:hypothetical protein
MGVGIIINHHCYLPQEPEYEFYAGDGYTKYMEDEKKHQLEKPDGTLSSESVSNLEEHKRQSFAQYEAREGLFEGKGGDSHLILFNKYGNEYNANRSQRAAKNSIIYSLVISFNLETSKLNNFDKDKAKKIAQHTFLKIMNANKKWGFDSNYFNYDAVLHKNTGRHHIHMRIYQPQNTPKEKIMDRMKLSQWGFNEAKFEIANSIEGLKENKEIFTQKKQFEEKFKEIHGNLLKTLSESQIRTECKKELDFKFNVLCKHQASVYKLFKAQPNSFTYQDRKTGKTVQKTGLAF